MREPIIYSKGPIFSQGDYDVFIGALEEDKLPQYVVINRLTKVVEFTHENTAIYKDWLSNFAKSEEVVPKQQTLNLSRTN